VPRSATSTPRITNTAACAPKNVAAASWHATISSTRSLNPRVESREELTAQLTAQAEPNWYGASGECGIDAIPTALRDALAETTDLLRVAER
jgi:hypothetical protein